MPEGDTLHKVAAYMQARLPGQPLTEVRLLRRRAPHLLGGPVKRVVAIGKHLLLDLQAWTLRVHLGLFGSWHHYAVGQAWQKPAWMASLSLQTATELWVCFNAADVELLPPAALLKTPVGALGPDLLAANWQMAPVLQRLQQQPPTAVLIDVLLDQHVACGIGNVYKNDLCFFFRRHPLTPAAALTAAQWTDLFAIARQWLQSNVGGWRRTTTYDRRLGDRGPKVARLYVYGKAHCPACAGPLRREILGRQRRRTFWCPDCQPAST